MKEKPNDSESDDPQEDIFDVEDVRQQKEIEKAKRLKPVRWERGKGLARKN